MDATPTGSFYGRRRPNTAAARLRASLQMDHSPSSSANSSSTSQFHYQPGDGLDTRRTPLQAQDESFSPAQLSQNDFHHLNVTLLTSTLESALETKDKVWRIAVYLFLDLPVTTQDH